jgi:acyl-CoA thioesterase
VGSSFLDETAVRAVAPGRYASAIGPDWNLRPLPQGGVVTALALRAMEDALGESAQAPRTLHTTFAGQVTDGPVEIEVEVLRRGRSMSQARAEVRNPGAARGHLTTAVFGTEREGFSFTELQPPDVPPPAECPSFRDPPPPDADLLPMMAFWERCVEGRAASGHAPWEDYVPEVAERAMWYRLDHPAMSDAGILDPLALVVLADTMPGAVGERVGPQERPWFGPSVDLTVHLLDDCRSEWVLAHNRARYAGNGYASADMALWDCGDDGTGPARLVAYGTQLFFFTFAR